MFSERARLIEASDLCFLISCGINALTSIREAMETGPSTPESAIPGLLAVETFLYDLAADLRQAVDGGLRDGKEVIA